MRTLELFAGTQSFSKGIKRHNLANETITIDILNKFKPTIQANLLEWNYKVYDPGYFDVIWASPPCTEYSKAKTIGKRNLELADSLVAKSFEIIDYYKPKIWILENVGTGLLVQRMETIRSGLKSYFVDYCAYGKSYRKRTILWSNINLDLKLCSGKGNCAAMNGSKHKGSVGNGTKKYNEEGINSVWEKDEIPELLIDSIVSELNPTSKTDSLLGNK